MTTPKTNECAHVRVCRRHPGCLCGCDYGAPGGACAVCGLPWSKATKTIVGVDPGPTTGVCVLTWRTGARKPQVYVAQCSAELTLPVVAALLDLYPGAALAVERFVIGRSTMRSGKHGTVTAELVAVLDRLARERRLPMVKRSASEVKPWATDRRLGETEVLAKTTGMRHARDAGRHALFAACAAAGLPDPMSRKAATA